MTEYVQMTTPIGELTIVADADKLRYIGPTPPSELGLDPTTYQPDSPLLMVAVDQLQAYFNRELTLFDLPLDREQGTPFQQEVWRYAEHILYGETVSYRELALRIGQPTATRAVANALSANPLLIVIPCHRVVRSDHTLGGFAYGEEMKRALLQVEE